MVLRNRPAHIAAFLGVLLAGGTVVVINPSRGDDRTTADIAALDLPVIIGGTDDLAKVVGGQSGSTVVAISTLDAEPDLLNAGDDRKDPPTRCRGADVDQRHHRPAEAHRPHLRHARAQRDRSSTGDIARTDGGSQRRRDRQRTAGAHRRRVPGVAMRRRGQAVRAARPFRPRQVGRRRAQASAHARCPWCPPHCGWCCTPICAAKTSRASAPSPRAPRRCRPTTPTPSPRSSAFRC